MVFTLAGLSSESLILRMEYLAISVSWYRYSETMLLFVRIEYEPQHNFLGFLVAVWPLW